MKSRPAFLVCVRVMFTLMTSFAPASDMPAVQLDPGAPVRHPGDLIPTLEEFMVQPHVSDEGRRTSHRLALAGLGLLTGLFGTIWRLRRRVARRRRFQTARPFNHAQPTDGAGGHNAGARIHAGAKHRVRRFDYDRFYLHLIRDL